MHEVERQAVQSFLNELVISENRLYDHVSDTFRWQMATLFTANGGAMVALASDKVVERPGVPLALGCFTLGVILSLIMGESSSIQSLRGGMRMHQLRSKLERALVTDQSPSEDIRKYGESERVGWRVWIPTGFGIGSLICFIMGVATIALSR